MLEIKHAKMKTVYVWKMAAHRDWYLWDGSDHPDVIPHSRNFSTDNIKRIVRSGYPEDTWTLVWGPPSQFWGWHP